MASQTHLGIGFFGMEGSVIEIGSDLDQSDIFQSILLCQINFDFQDEWHLFFCMHCLDLQDHTQLPERAEVSITHHWKGSLWS